MQVALILACLVASAASLTLLPMTFGTAFQSILFLVMATLLFSSKDGNLFSSDDGNLKSVIRRETVPQTFTQTSLEETILSLAKGKLQLMESLLTESATAEGQSEFMACWSELNALVELGLIANSGMTEAGVKIMHDVEQKQADLWASWPRQALTNET